jgi:SET domain-containing protein
VECYHSETPAMLHMQHQLSSLLVVRAVADILPGDEVLMAYGHKFWKETKSTAAGTHD